MSFPFLLCLPSFLSFFISNNHSQNCICMSMNVCVCVYLPLIFTSCYAALLAHDRFPRWLPIFFPNHSPFSKRKQSPVHNPFGPQNGKKRKVDNSNFLLLDRKKEKGNFVRRWALKLQVIPDIGGGGINNFLRSIIGKQGFSQFLHYIPLCIYVSIYLCSKKILYKGHGTLGFKKTPAHI